MTDRTIAMRLAAIGRDRVQAELRGVGATAIGRFQRIEQAPQPASPALHAMDAAAGEERGKAPSPQSRVTLPGTLGRGSLPAGRTCGRTPCGAHQRMQ